MLKHLLVEVPQEDQAEHVLILEEGAIEYFVIVQSMTTTPIAIRW